VDEALIQPVAALAAGGTVTGLVLLVRGLRDHRTAGRITDIATSRIASLASGEVRVSGTVEPAAVLLVSALQSEPCVYYRSTIHEGRDRDRRDPVLDEERAVGFRVRDASGSLRIFPRGARFDVPPRFDAASSLLDGEPTALRTRTGPPYTTAEPDRDEQVAALLGAPAAPETSMRHPLLRAGRGERRYREARIEVGDVVTVVGRAIPFGDLDHPAEADISTGALLPADDPEVAESIARARAEGTLLTDPALAWGNAAIPGFGIGRPVREPVLHAEAHRPAVAPAEEATRAERTFHITRETPVVAAGGGVPLLISAGDPGTVVERHRQSLVLGLLGAALTIASVMALAMTIGSGGAR
jgi:hypothetical protein